MTLITYPTRVHFADHVLQDALQAEMERMRCKLPLVVYENCLLESEFFYRVMEGIPSKLKPTQLTYTKNSHLSDVASSVADGELNFDVIIAFGTARAIELGRKCRYALSLKKLNRPALFAVPGIDGLPNPCTRNLDTWRSGLPSVLICDPTVTLNANSDQTWRSTILSLVRCIESYLANAYNPPADGMALDALNRCVANFAKLGEQPNLDIQRELMAAGLNSALAQEKGMGPTLTLAAALESHNANVNQTEAARILLPSVIEQSSVDESKSDVLMKVVGGSDPSLASALGRLMQPAPMPGRLSELGVSYETIDDTAHAVKGKANLDYSAARNILEAAF